MSKFVQVDTDIFVTCLDNTLHSKEVKRVRVPVNHIWIYDRSGSMTHLLPSLALDVIKHVDTMHDDDFLSLGWFSSEGQYRFLLKGSRVGPDRDYIKRIVLENFKPIGMTCFSEILQETSQSLITDLMPLSTNYSLMFFTDGYPVVSNYKKEIERIRMYCEALGNVLTTAMVVGYGHHYNREVLSEMSSLLNGSLIHSSRLEEYSSPMSEFVHGTTLIEPLVKLPVPDSIAESTLRKAFTIEKHGVVHRTIVDEDYTKSFVSVPGSSKVVYFIIDKQPKERYIEKGAPSSSVDMLYAASNLLVSENNADLAMRILGKLGDIRFIDEINNAWTNDEFGRANSKIFEAVYNGNERMAEGRDVKYLPNPNKFCLIEALETIMADDQCLFVPGDPSFKYERIGPKTTPREGYAKFVYDSDAEIPFDITWNSTRLNLSLLVRIPGTVDLGEEAQKYNLVRNYKTFVFRNYTIVKDGALNVTVLPMKLSKGTFALFQREKMIPTGMSYNPRAVYPVNLRRIPIVNKRIMDINLDANSYCRNLLVETRLMARQKVINAKFEEYYPKDTRVEKSNVFTDDQIKFLESKCIGRNGYNPPVDVVPIQDFYYAKEFDVKIAGLSSLPKVLDVEQKMKSAARLTNSQDVIAEQLVWYERQTSGKTPPMNWFEEKLAQTRKELRALRSDMNKTRFVILVGKRWFSDLKERDGAKLSVDGNDFTFTIRDIQVEY